MMDLDAVLSQPVLLPSSPMDSGVFPKEMLSRKPRVRRKPTIVVPTPPPQPVEVKVPTARELEEDADSLLGHGWLAYHDPKREIVFRKSCISLESRRARRFFVAESLQEEVPSFEAMSDEDETVFDPDGSDQVAFEASQYSSHEWLAKARNTYLDPRPHVLQSVVGQVLKLISVGKTDDLATSVFRLETCLSAPEYGAPHIDQVVDCIAILAQELTARRQTETERERFEQALDEAFNSRGALRNEDVKDAKFNLMTFDEACEKASEERLQKLQESLKSLVTPTEMIASSDGRKITYHARPQPTEVIKRLR